MHHGVFLTVLLSLSLLNLCSFADEDTFALKSNEAELKMQRLTERGVILHDASFVYQDFEIITIKAGEFLHLTCLAAGTKIQPTFLWTLNGSPIKSPNGVLMRLLNEDINAYSRLSIPITKNDNGAEVKCSVSSSSATRRFY